MACVLAMSPRASQKLRLWKFTDSRTGLVNALYAVPLLLRVNHRRVDHKRSIQDSGFKSRGILSKEKTQKEKWVEYNIKIKWWCTQNLLFSLFFLHIHLSKLHICLTSTYKQSLYFNTFLMYRGGIRFQMH